MAAVFVPHIPTVVGLPAGASLFAFKEHAVNVGWVVKGSGDGQGRFGYEGYASVALAERGSGGEFDCWLAAPQALDSTDAGDVNANAWVVLENDGRELLLVATSGTTSSYAGDARIAYCPKGAGGFDGSVADPDTIPDANAQEWWTHGSRLAPLGVTIFTDGPGYLHLFGDDTAELGALPLGFACFGDDLSPDGALSIAPVVAGTESPSDADPVGLFYGTAGFDLVAVWNQPLGAMQSFVPPANGFYKGVGVIDPGGQDRVAAIPGTIGTGTKFEKGTFSHKAIAWSGSPRTYPDTTTGLVGGATTRFAYADAGMLFPFPNGVTPHSP